MASQRRGHSDITLPACLTTFDADSSAFNYLRKPKRFYEVISSRPRRTIQVADGIIGVWSPIAPTRCLLSLEGYEERLRQGFLICVLREFDEAPQ